MKRVGKSLAFAVSVPLMLMACATIGPPQPPSLQLPQPPSDLRAFRKGDRVNLSWTIPTMTTDRETVRSLGPTLICRGFGELTACSRQVGAISTPVPAKTASSGQRPQGVYADALPPQLQSDSLSGFITYAVQVLNREGRGAGISNQVQVSLARTLPPPRDFRARVSKQGVVLTWAAAAVPISPEGISYVYRVFRRAEGSNEEVVAGEAPADAETSFTVTDANIEWQQTYYYHAEAVTKIQRPNKAPLEVEGDDTAESKVFADDVFPPTVPAELQAVFSGPGQKPFVDLVWAPVTDADLAGYNVYRRQEGTNPVKLNAELIKAPAYRDEQVNSGTRYFYSVSAVDVRGNESAPSEEASEVVP